MVQAMTTDNDQNNEKREGYRHSDLDSQQVPEDIVEVIEESQERMRRAFNDFCKSRQWTNARTLREFYPFISNETAVTKIKKGVQAVPYEVILVMALCFGYSLDEIFLGKPREDFIITPEERQFFIEFAKKLQPCENSNSHCSKADDSNT